MPSLTTRRVRFTAKLTRPKKEWRHRQYLVLKLLDGLSQA